MDIRELHEALPEEFRITPETLPPAIAEAIDFLIARDALIESGTSPASLPTIEEWKQSHDG